MSEPVESMVDIDMSGVNKLAASIQQLVDDFHKRGLLLTRNVNGQAETLYVQIAPVVNYHA